VANHSSGQVVFSFTHMEGLIYLNAREEVVSMTITQPSNLFLPVCHFISLFHIFCIFYLFHYSVLLTILDLLSFPRFPSSLSHPSFMYTSCTL
jgi:hypothetical protein